MTRIMAQVNLTKHERSAISSAVVATFRPAERYDGVRPINIYVLRLVCILMFFILDKQTWTHILTHQGAWDSTDAVAWCVWMTFGTLADLGSIRPLSILPILLLEIFYKVLWLGLVADPLWSKGTLAGLPAEEMASAFLWVLLPIAATRWGCAFVHYIYDPKHRLHPIGSRVQPSFGGQK